VKRQRQIFYRGLVGHKSPEAIAKTVAFVEGGYQRFDVQVGGGKTVHLGWRSLPVR
jgi:hypothetical protein